MNLIGANLSPSADIPALAKLPGLGKVRLKALAAAGIHSSLDLLLLLPKAYEDRRQLRSLKHAMESQLSAGALGTPLRVCAPVRVLTVDTFYARGKRVPKVWVEDEDKGARGCLLLFGRPFLAKQLVPGSNWLLSANFQFRYGALQSSVFEMESPQAAAEFFRIRPRYKTIEGVSPVLLSASIGRVLQAALPHLRDNIDSFGPARRAYAELKLPDIASALNSLHRPDDLSQVPAARRRLAFAELAQLLIQQHRNNIANKDDGGTTNQGSGSTEQNMDGTGPRTEASSGDPGAAAPAPPVLASAAENTFSPLQSRLLGSLPFELTEDQQSCVLQINKELRGGGSMQRLIQGDVGSGKTLVALLAAVAVVESGGQCAFMVPTEILAGQHKNSMQRMLSALNSHTDTNDDLPPLELLSAALDAAEQQRVREKAAAGVPGIYLGTHSLFSQKTEFARLELIVIDEQQRFGVAQRSQLRAKASCDRLLMLSATPIPRTLSLTLFGGMDISVIRSMPKGRKPIITHLAAMGKEEKVYQAVREQLDAGGQAYFVYPRIEQDDEDQDESSRGAKSAHTRKTNAGGQPTLIDNPSREQQRKPLKSAEEMAEVLKQRFAPQKVALVHGRMESELRRKTMENFAAGRIAVLVATTVIEVGMDVPNASVMVVEHAERFGLSALHQLRGRVGRGELQSYCYLVYDPALSEDGKQRLRVMKESCDGFRIAEEDLRIRGPGNMAGTEQSGYLNLAFASLYEDGDIIEAISRSLH